MKSLPTTSRRTSPVPSRLATIAVAGSLALCAPWLLAAEATPAAASTVAAATMSPAASAGSWQRHAKSRSGADRCVRGSGARAGYPDAMDGRHFGRGLSAELALSEEQRDRIFAIRHAAEPKFRDQAKKLRALRDEFRQAAQADTFDEAKVRSLAQQRGQAIGEMMQMRAQQQAGIQAVLTPQQREKMQQRQKHPRHERWMMQGSRQS